MADNEFLTGYLSGQSEGRTNNNDGLFGNGWEGIIGLIVILALLGGGFGMGGFGFGGGGRNNGCGCGCATQADVRAAVDQQTLISKLDQQTYGLADSTYALNNTIVNGFHGVDNAICNLGYQTQAGFNALSAQQASCCCETQRLIERGFCDTNYNIATQTAALQNTMCGNTRDIIDATNAGTRAVLDFLTQDKIATLTAENQNLKFAASQARQNDYLTAAMDANVATILRRTGHDCPTAAYLVQPPTPVNFPTNGCGTVQFGYNGWGGCGCGCAA